MIKVILIAVAIAVLGVIPFMGISGALVVYLAKPTTNLIYGPLAFEHWMTNLGDRAWPLAIMLSLVWPVFIPLAYFFAMRLAGSMPFFSLKPMSVFFVILLAGCVLTGQIGVIASGTIKRLSRQEIVHAATLSGDVGQLKRYYKPEDLGTMKVDPLREAIFSRKTKVARFLIESRDDLSRYFPEGDQNSVQFASPLHTAVNVGSVEVLRLLLQKKADPNKRNNRNQTPLHALSWDPDGDGTVVDLLREAGADCNAGDVDGNTPIMMLTGVLNHWEQMPDYAQKLMKGGADPHHKNNAGNSALDYARQNHHTDMVEFLEKLAPGKTKT